MSASSAPDIRDRFLDQLQATLGPVIRAVIPNGRCSVRLVMKKILAPNGVRRWDRALAGEQPLPAKDFQSIMKLLAQHRDAYLIQQLHEEFADYLSAWARDNAVKSTMRGAKSISGKNRAAYFEAMLERFGVGRADLSDPEAVSALTYRAVTHMGVIHSPREAMRNAEALISAARNDPLEIFRSIPDVIRDSYGALAARSGAWIAKECGDYSATGRFLDHAGDCQSHGEYESRTAYIGMSYHKLLTDGGRGTRGHLDVARKNYLAAQTDAPDRLGTKSYNCWRAGLNLLEAYVYNGHLEDSLVAEFNNRSLGDSFTFLLDQLPIVPIGVSNCIYAALCEFRSLMFFNARKNELALRDISEGLDRINQKTDIIGTSGARLYAIKGLILNTISPRSGNDYIKRAKDHFEKINHLDMLRQITKMTPHQETGPR